MLYWLCVVVFVGVVVVVLVLGVVFVVIVVVVVVVVLWSSLSWGALRECCSRAFCHIMLSLEVSSGLLLVSLGSLGHRLSLLWAPLLVLWVHCDRLGA